MRIAMFDTHQYDREPFERANAELGHMTSHQAFLTNEALASIAHVTLENVAAFERGEPLKNEVRPEQVFESQPKRSA